MQRRNRSGGFLAALAAGAVLMAGGTVAPAASASAVPSQAPPTVPSQIPPRVPSQVPPNARPATPESLAAAGHVLPDFGNPAGTAYVPPAAGAADATHPDHVIGTGTPASCTSAAVVAAVASGGVTTFDCGPHPVTITMTATAKVVNTVRWVVLDGGGLITLDGGGKRQILYQNTCDPKQKIIASDCYDQQWPHLIVQNMTFADGYSATRQSKTKQFGGGGGGAIFDLGGQLKVVNSRFIDNGCYQYGPDLGGGAIRALAQWNGQPVYITSDTFQGGRCSNGGALSSIGTSWMVLNSVMTGNSAIGYGQNPPQPGTPGGGSGGAIYTDGNDYSVIVNSTVLKGNSAREGGGAIFFVSNNRAGSLTVKNSHLLANPSAVFWTRPYPGIYFHGSRHHLSVTNSTVG